MSLRRSNGFTLVELMVTIAVVALLAVIAFPNFQGTIRSNRIAMAGNEVTGLLSLARSEAVRNKRGGGVCGSASGTSCDGAWSSGMLAWADVNGDGNMGAGEAVLRFVAITPDSVAATGPAAVVAFDNRGRRRAAATQEIVIQPVKCGSDSLRRTLTVNAAGQITSTKAACK
ncbi:TPA: GspH/FimT family pseudopilin [Stenotrophomonas maltophilia]|uniref:GspH/FimT family pseudopilin n=1 Tax=Stenotrophomonas sp. TaxID=69392 RepID=UPI0028AF5A30|nr:GspH/FimT family pseudopilin [Stenotrophomonas sp.]HDS0947968.1 GspH/FimT family pseudopilin [Stenotrophomonas maltophilia]HDS1025381.1 GspH/FimT family pseudopilin [Stenotrophomonas maltophilia]HDS1030544.1 GspH/FimT family pseudopilin [Stenotrophomonas maltophilia]HDS1035411.1 GspH/FimT family pseudopilin [Stenotrophomonas maltophilia]HDS1038743.1 GspH/FimT family pseudopilin [Stenotrophomonas maltophilia]